MGLREKIATFIGLDEKSVERMRPVYAGIDGVPTYPTNSFENWAKHGFGRNELVYSCIMEKATSFPEAHLKVYQETDSGEEEHEDHPLRQLLAKPNSVLTEYEQWEMTLIHLEIAGNAFWEIERDNAGRPIGLWLLNPAQVRMIPRKGKDEYDYAYDVGQGQLVPLGTDVIHFRYPNPVDPLIGQPPLRSAVRAVATDNEATDFTKVLLQNRAVPGVVVKAQNAIDGTTARRLTRKWKQKFSGSKRGEPAFLQQGMDVEVIGLNMKDLQFGDLRKTSESRICMVFGVPPILVGAAVGLDRSTFANYGEARKSFWEETLMPLQRRFRDKVVAELLPEFGISDNVIVKWDNSQVTALQESADAKWKRAVMGYRAEIVKKNEARLEIGLDPVDDGDDFFSKEKPGAGSGIEGDSDGDGEANEGKRKAWEVLAEHQYQTKTAQNRLNQADTFVPRVKEFVNRELAAQARDFTREFAEVVGKAPMTSGEISALALRLERLEARWAARIAQDAVPIFRELLDEAAERASVEVGFSYDPNNADAADFAHRYGFKFAEKVSATSVADIQGVLTKATSEGFSVAETRGALLETFKTWSKERAELVSRTETIRAANMGAREGYLKSGVKKIRWLAVGDSCAYCVELDGTVIDIYDPFIEQGQEFHAPGASTPLKADYEAVETPPAHPNCRCAIAAEN